MVSLRRSFRMRADDRVEALRLDRHVAVRAELRAQLHEQQAQEVVDLGLRGHRALRAAAAGALLDRHRGRDAEDRVHVGLRRRLHELARVGVERLEVAPLALGEDDVEGERGLARARDAGHHGELAARDLDVDALQVVLARVAHEDRMLRRGGDGVRAVHQLREAQVLAALLLHGLRDDAAQCHLVVAQRLAGVRGGVRHHLRRRALGDDLAAGIAALGAEVDDPVGRRGSRRGCARSR